MKYQVRFTAKTSYLHRWRDHRRYGYIINRVFESKLIWYFTGVYVINRILHTLILAYGYEFYFLVFNSISRESLRSLVRYRVDHSTIKFISTHGHVISSIFSINIKANVLLILNYIFFIVMEYLSLFANDWTDNKNQSGFRIYRNLQWAL